MNISSRNESIASLDAESVKLPTQTRHHALTEMLRQRREDFFRLDGVVPVSVSAEDVTFESANTSLQLHYRVDLQQFADTFNAV